MTKKNPLYVKRGTLTPLEFKSKKRLPKTLSGWIVSAVRDAQKLEKTPGFVLDMYTFNSFRHSPEKTCYVCLGGAAIVGCGLVQPGGGTNGGNTTYLADCLDSIRKGRITLAMDLFYGWDWQSCTNREIYHKLEDLEYSYRDMYVKASGIGRMDWPVYLEMAAELKAMGL